MSSYIYDRKSRPTQSSNEDLMNQYCQRNNLEVKNTFIDYASGKTPHNNRPEWKKMANKLKDGDKIIMEKIDRFSREVVDGILQMEYLEKLGVEMIFVHESIDTATAMGRFNFKLKLLLAQLERELTVERTVTTLSLKRQRGEKDTRQRYGWDSNNEPIKDEIKILRRIRYELHHDWTITEIAQSLNDGNRFKRGGKKWTASDIWKINNGKHFEMLDLMNLDN